MAVTEEQFFILNIFATGILFRLINKFYLTHFLSYNDNALYHEMSELIYYSLGVSTQCIQYVIFVRTESVFHIMLMLYLKGKVHPKFYFIWGGGSSKKSLEPRQKFYFGSILHYPPLRRKQEFAAFFFMDHFILDSIFSFTLIKSVSKYNILIFPSLISRSVFLLLMTAAHVIITPPIGSPPPSPNHSKQEVKYKFANNCKSGYFWLSCHQQKLLEMFIRNFFVKESS